MLNRCIATDPATFAGDYWGQRPLLSRAAHLPRDFCDLLTDNSIDELIAERGVRAPFIRMAREGALLSRETYLGPAGFGAQMPDQVDSAKVLAEFSSGATIVLQGLHRLWPPVIDFVRAMIDDLGHPTQANAYITPPSSRGFDPHYDVHDVFVLQTSGRKHWMVHPPVHLDPLADQPWSDHRSAVVARAREDPVIDTVVEAGDALYIPRGWVHSAQALGETSIHLTVGVSAVTHSDVVRLVVDELSRYDHHFRASLPMAVDLTSPHETHVLAAKAIASLADRLRDHPGDLADAVATRLTGHFAARTRPAAVRPLDTLSSLNSLTVEHAVCWRHALIATFERDSAQRAVLRLTDRTIEFPESCSQAVQALHSGRTYRIADLPGLDEADALVLTRRLLREAVIVLDR